MDFYFIKLFIIYYYHYLFWCSNCPKLGQWKAFTSWLLCPFNRSPPSFEHNFTLWHHKELSVHLILLLPQFWIQPFLKESRLLKLGAVRLERLRTLKTQVNQANKLRVMELRLKQCLDPWLYPQASELSSGFLVTWDNFLLLHAALYIYYLCNTFLHHIVSL